MPPKPKKQYPKQYFKSLEEIYRLRFGAFLSLANRHIYNKDYAIDAVHEAFEKSVEYFNKNTTRKVREQIIQWRILRACKRLNKYGKEVPVGIDFSGLEEAH